jgi:hypothetical protein
MGKVRKLALTAGAMLTLAGSGCYSSGVPWLGLFVPVPVPAWVSERMEEKYCYKNDERTPVMPPIREGFPPPLCEDPPADAEVLRKMPRITRGVPYVYEEFRDGVQVVTERIKDQIDPPRFYPLIGPAQLHHCHWKCTIYYLETVESGWPFPFQCKRQRVQVIYIDKDHLHLYAGNNPQLQQTYQRETTGY